MSERDVGREIQSRMEDAGLIPEAPPPFTYYESKSGKMFCWTTEPDEFDKCPQCDGYGEWIGESSEPESCPTCRGDGKGKGWYFSFVLKPVGKGARKGKASEWALIESSLSKHRKRKDAKKRASRLHDKEEA